MVGLVGVWGVRRAMAGLGQQAGVWAVFFLCIIGLINTSSCLPYAGIF